MENRRLAFHTTSKKLKKPCMKTLLIILFTWTSLATLAQTPIVYDVVLQGGRVMDPETKLDAINLKTLCFMPVSKE